MQHKEYTFAGYNGTTLYGQSWQPDDAPKAKLAMVHGFGEHSGRYANLVNYFVPRGYALYGFDLRGHGRSSGLRGHIMRWHEYRSDVGVFMSQINQSNIPVFLYGHSLGGLILLDYALNDPVKLNGIIVSAPSLGKVAISPLLFVMSKIISSVYPKFTLHTGLDATMISRDPDVVSAYMSDPQVHDMATARLGTELSSVQAWVQSHAGDLRLPVLMFQGSADRLTSPADGKRFFSNVPDGSKRYIAYEGSSHEVHNDLDHHLVTADMDAWMKGCLVG